MNTIPLPGCSPTPLAAYLKALGILRVLALQYPEANPQGCWKGNTFELRADCDEEGLKEFFLHRYAPTPVVAPWNGGSGFYPKDNSAAVEAIATSESPRFAEYRQTIETAREVINSLGLEEKPEKKAKESLLLRCRNAFSDSALEWLDSAFVILDGGAKYPPLLGTGGNDGRLEFTNNFMQRVTELIDPATGEPSANAPRLLDNALFDFPIKGLQDSPIGQFSPSATGGANASTGFDSKGAMNPWDFILTLEGAMVFAAAVVKRLEDGQFGQLAFPFCVRPSGVGYGSSADSDEKEARCEIWMPLWGNPCDLGEIRNLFREGRAWVGNRVARTGLDFALSIASLGVDRGIREFVRFGFHVRNGLAYFATPLGRLPVTLDPAIVQLLADCDGWITGFQAKADPDKAPASIARVARRLEAAIIARATASQADGTALELLIALGDCERAMVRSLEWCKKERIDPIPPLRRTWVKFADDFSAEFRLATALASISSRFGKEVMPLRRHLEPVRVVTGERPIAKWDDSMKNEVVWSEGDLTEVLCNIMRRRLLLAKASGMKSWPERGKVTAWIGDVADFIDGVLDDRLLGQALWGLSLIDFSGSGIGLMPKPPTVEKDERVPAFYAQLKLCFAGNLPEGKEVPIEPIIFNLASRGDGERASRQALRRLHGSNIPVTHIKIPLEGDSAKRSAAALLFPLWHSEPYEQSQLARVGRVVAPQYFKETQLI